MTRVTSDPVVAMVYGALAFPSQRPALDTASALVDGQPGPWELPDDDQAALAEQIVARLSRPAPTGAAVDVLAGAVALNLGDAIDRAVRLMSEFYDAERDHLPVDLSTDVDLVQERLIIFGAKVAVWASGSTVRVQPGGPLPSLEEACGWRSDQWIVLLRQLRVRQADAMRAVRTAAEEAGKTPPANLREIEGRTDLVRHMLAFLAECLPTQGGRTDG